MKSNFSLCLFALLFIIATGCSNSASKGSANQTSLISKNLSPVSITIEDPKPSKSDYFFTTSGGKMVVMCSASTAKQIDSMLYAGKGFTLYDVGVGNAFLTHMAGKTYLCTATHAAQGLESITTFIGADIALIDDSALSSKSYISKNMTDRVEYEMDPSPNTDDSVFVRGYLPLRLGGSKSVTISGVGEFSDADKQLNDPTIQVSGHREFMQKHSIVMRMSQNVDLGGLSGAPAFNKAGKVIGVYSGRTYSVVPGQTDTSWYARVSLFN